MLIAKWGKWHFVVKTCCSVRSVAAVHRLCWLAHYLKSSVFFWTHLIYRANKIEFLSPTHSIWLIPKIPSRWENLVICSFKCELKNSQSYLLFFLKSENITGLAMVLVVNQWPVTVKAWVKSHSSPSGICDKVTQGQGFLQVLQFATIHVILPLVHAHISFICLCAMSNWKHC
jgi:hypothetical protein